MRGLVVTGPGEVELTDVPVVAAGPGQVVVAPRVVGVCGTDLDIVDATIDPAFVRYPVVLGHEWAGVVESVGPTAGDVVRVGDLVVVEGIVPCGGCPACLTGDTNRCETYDEFGFTRDGAAQDRVVAPRSLVHRLADGRGAEAGALVEPCAVVYRALARAGPAEGGRVLVVGDGTVALLVVHLVRLWSPAEVVMVGRRPEQADLAHRAGADRFVTELAGPDTGFDLVIEAAGSAGASTMAIRAAARGAAVVLLGFPGPGVTLDVAVDDVVNADLTIMGSFSYTSSAWRAVVDLLNAGRIDPTVVVTHRFPIARWSDALATLRGDGVTGPRGKVLLTLD